MKEVVSMKNGSSKTSKQVKIMEMNDTQSRKIKETLPKLTRTISFTRKG